MPADPGAQLPHELHRGGEQELVELWETRLAAPVEDDKMLQAHGAFDTLAREDALKAEIVKLRHFVGLKNQEIAEALEVNAKTVRRHWELAKIRLYEIIAAEDGTEPEAA